MTFKALCNSIKNSSEEYIFQDASKELEKVIFGVKKEDLIKLVKEIGIIPESIAHDSKEEKLYAKVSDIILSRCFYELNMNVTVIKERANNADVLVSSKYHNYSLVADAKAFRLSRTAKNQKDFKVESMYHWKGDNDYSVLVVPYFQYPQHKSQIYGQALNKNISLFSWEYFVLMLEANIKETEEKKLSQLWNISAMLSNDTSVSNKNFCFLSSQNKIILQLLNLDESKLNKLFCNFKTSIIKRSKEEISYWENQILKIKEYSKEKAISELISALKINEKILSIKKFSNLLLE